MTTHTAALRLLATVLLAATALLGAAGVANASGPPTTESGGTSPVVVYGVVGLTWSDVSPGTTPNLWRLLDDGAAAAAASTHVPGDPCPLNGWLTISSGRPSSALTSEETCLGARVVGGPQDARIDGWDALVARQADSVYEPELGLLAASLQEQGVCSTAVGTGPAVALADGEGRVGDVAVDLAVAGRRCPVTLVDGGVVTPEDPGSVGRADQQLGRLVSALPADATLMVATVGAAPTQKASMGVALLWDAATTPPDPRYLSSTSTRWDGVVTLLDVPATVLALADGTSAETFVGDPWRVAGPRPGTAATVEHLAMIGERDKVLRQAAPWFLSHIGVVSLLLLLFLSVLPGHGRTWLVETPARRAVALGALVFAAALPAASYLVGAVPWWVVSAPLAGLLGAALLLTTLLTAAGVVLARRLGGVVAAWAVAVVTMAVLVVDAAGGSFLDRASPAGPSPTFGGRFYGFGNTTAAYFSVSALFVACLTAGLLLSRGRRRAAAVAFTAVSLLTVVVDTAPALGADVGGGLALVPVLVLCGLALMGARVTVGRVVLAFVLGVAAVAALGLVDWLRPPESRTHLGKFVQDVLDGTATPIIARKAGYVLGSVDLWPATWLTFAALGFIAYQLVAVRRTPPEGVWRDLLADRPVMLALAGSTGVLVLSGLLNDYGIQVVTIGLLLLVPLTLLSGYSSTAGFTRLYAGPAPGPETSVAEPATAPAARPVD